MTATDQIRTVIRDLEAKAKEMELDKKLTTFADQADHYLRVAATRAGEYAAENRERVESTLDKAGAKVDEKTDGKYHRTVDKLKTGVLTGVDWVVEQRETGAADPTRPDDPTGPTDATAAAGATTTTASGAAAPAPSSTDSWVDVTDAPATHDPKTEGPTDPQ
ncbi:MAG TPA: antitoxin [Ornithinibacter sp.]|nr:antitoxin [Ornithinibacter sp.]